MSEGIRKMGLFDLLAIGAGLSALIRAYEIFADRSRAELKAKLKLLQNENETLKKSLEVIDMLQEQNVIPFDKAKRCNLLGTDGELSQ